MVPLEQPPGFLLVDRLVVAPMPAFDDCHASSNSPRRVQRIHPLTGVAAVSAVNARVTLFSGVAMEQTPSPEEVLFWVRSRHVAAAGMPPRIDADDANRYVGYFENAHGEQALFIYDRDAQTAMVYLGDAGWDTAHAVVGGSVPDLVLNESERLWVRACWQACRGE
jgi:hypothetical protein